MVAKYMKSWWVSVTDGRYKTLYEKQCLNGPAQATEEFEKAKEKFKDDPNVGKFQFYREWR